MHRSDRDLPSTIVQGRSSDEADRERVFRLSVMDGPERGRSIVLDGSASTRTLIGTSEACDVRVTDPEVSRRHAAIERVGKALRIVDLSSTNGTWVDRVKVFEAELRGGEFVRVGQTLFSVEVVADVDPAAAALPNIARFGRVVGASREMRRLYPLCSRLAKTTVPVIIEGETGTGKEALAESLHEQGPRANGPFVVFDCTAVPPSLVEAELFGHERGAFTGATTTRKGVFEQADGGTLLIDEVGDLDLSLQPKLLRAMERLEVRRIGGDRWIHVDVRVLSATRRDLDHEVQAGRFRDDLFHRLAVARIELPPLRHRVGDVTLLAEHFWRQMGGDVGAIPLARLAKWMDSSWPGNIRELRNVIARELALGDLATFTDEEPPATADVQAAAATDMSASPSRPDVIGELIAKGLPYPQARDRMLEEFDQRFVASLLANHGGDVARAAEASGIGRRYFQKLKARTKK
jgi:transcriptional regulator with GAF, ATPase, and Fis domain